MMGEIIVDALQDDQEGEDRGGQLSRRPGLGAGAAAALASALAANTYSAHHGSDAIWADWIALWNGDLGRAAQIIAPDITLHMTPIGGGSVAALASPAGMARWIGGLHAAMASLHFAVQVAPLFQGDMIAGRWLVTGRYAGGFPGAKAKPGTPIAFAGADFLRIKDGKIAEYWLSADVLDLMGQLGMIG